mmetsp:Transcript_13128/g.15889  ORF Transcript_13128/g.15889 Transcript_13128/m.15889 type:complete len:704 (+) Transcript_13128:221-2332(+)|eukprot:CAMPEP_0197860180 /NCGR_PEP_ID=MMETSP1438-20131217/35373_1 /TAXON_ID=1461541 /ORGANISM="Pterosperma sp., Strain CCMP1384" /LENGTH=703 /DNA_ID=CAMNT_0043476953 /DNA_START=212 /DNA_END=2323 /DNA_ORIENTATION=-
MGSDNSKLSSENVREDAITNPNTENVPVDNESGSAPTDKPSEVVICDKTDLSLISQFTTGSEETTCCRGEETQECPCASTADTSAGCCSVEEHQAPVSGKIFYGSVKGTSKEFSYSLLAKCKNAGMSFEIVDMKDYDPEELSSEEVALFVVSTYTDGTPPDNAAWFCQWLAESSTDERVGSLHLQKLRFAVFGCGNSQYEDNFNVVGKRMDTQLAAMGATRLRAFMAGDEDNGHMPQAFSSWANYLIHVLGSPIGAVQPAAPLPNTEEDLEEETASEGESEIDESEAANGSDDDIDMEDIGGAAPRRGQKPHVLKEVNGEKKEMVTPKLRANLTKQGYKILGSHSGVKLCRWTKAMMRGRGGCYKHTFYGIESHRCMEATPSLACANKCVFCWRHHTNPVGREWRWKMDPPLEIVEQAVAGHQQMVKQCRGIPGIVPGRIEEGMDVAHCALSLVGEPIMYPEINTFLAELHRRRISSFLVTNAQFPDRILNLCPVTQLYVSVDAATEDTLKAIDRPLFKDFWQRFNDSLSALKEKQQRTVYRLTLVKGWNAEEVENYANLVSLGQPDFIEIKGVTFCGEISASNLTMQNVPYHEEVCAFSSAICDRLGGEYGLACAHVHSCCVLLARKNTYLKDGRWHTWINYNKFQDLVAQGVPFTSEDYMEPTPDWAVYGAEEGGFDPCETRFKKVRKHKAKEDQNTENAP